MQHVEHRLDIRRQRGMASLFVTMIVLLVVMLLGVTAAFLSSTQFKLSANLQLENAAFNLAEGANNAAQAWLITNNNWKNAAFTTYVGATPWLYPLEPAAGACTLPKPKYPTGAVQSGQCQPLQDWELKIAWDDNTTCGVQADQTCGSFSIGELNTSRYIIQKIASCQRTMQNEPSLGKHNKTNEMRADLFRITSLGTAARSTKKIIQTIYTVVVPADAIEKENYCTPT